jgi:hypothetical protein
MVLLVVSIPVVVMQMLSVGVPQEAVLQRIRNDGLLTPQFRAEAGLS